jgi:hypothetical protein
LHLFVLPPRFPKLNGAVERASRTYTQAFYQVTDCSLEMKKRNREIAVENNLQHGAASSGPGYLTPLQSLLHLSSQTKGLKCVNHLLHLLDEYVLLRGIGQVVIFSISC